MPIPTIEHYFEQAERLLLSTRTGAPRQVDIRRAISNSYYGLFHFVLTAIGDEFVGVSYRNTPRYALVYRSVDHRTLKVTAIEAKRTAPSSKFAPYAPATGWGSEIHVFSAVVMELQEKRHGADYDPHSRFEASDGRLAIGTARQAIASFQRASRQRRLAFLTLLLCPPR